MTPKFPEFKSIEMPDQEFLRELLWQHQSRTSELNFSNLYIWRNRYQYKWCMHNDNLVILSDRDSDSFALQPVGTGDLPETSAIILDWLHRERKTHNPSIQRADEHLAWLLEKKYFVSEIRDHFDYLYKRSSLVELAGNRYHAKRNQLNALKREHKIEYREFDDALLKGCNELIERWCGLHRCEEDMNLMSEWDAVAEALANVKDLKLLGGVLLVDGKVEAFTFGEMLNLDTMVVHVEKANPEIKGTYAMINQKFAESVTEAVFINREQDLGEFRLRQAKMSYYPFDFVKKFTISMAGPRNAK